MFLTEIRKRQNQNIQISLQRFFSFFLYPSLLILHTIPIAFWNRDTKSVKTWSRKKSSTNFLHYPTLLRAWGTRTSAQTGWYRFSTCGGEVVSLLSAEACCAWNKDVRQACASHELGSCYWSRHNTHSLVHTRVRENVKIWTCAARTWYEASQKRARFVSRAGDEKKW